MPGKVPHPWFRKGRGWFVWVGGKQHPLGQEKDEAHRRFHLLMAGESPTPNARTNEQTPKTTPASDLTVEHLVEKYLADAQRRLAKSTYRVARDFANSFAKACGQLPAQDVRKQHIEQWIATHPTWGSMTEWDAKNRLVAVFNWAVDQELVPANRISGIRKPPIRSRGTTTLISPEDIATILNAATPSLRHVLMALHQAGARPGEVISVTAKDFLPEQGIWILAKHKTAHKGHHRIVYLTPDMIALCRELSSKYTDGPLFRTTNGLPWCHTCYIAEKVRELRKRLGIKNVIPYGFRHTFATDALVKGVPDAQVAALLGHSGTAMLHKHYAHLGARAKALRDALDKVR
jgi:integrase